MIKQLKVYCENKIKINRRIVHKIVSELKSELNFSIDSLYINFISDKKIIQINKKYLNHNYSTDIITFNYSGSSSLLDGEIFISYNDAYDNSLKYKVSHNSELIRLIVHGILHLIGYDDKKATDRTKMKRIENKLVKKLLPDYEKLLLC